MSFVGGCVVTSLFLMVFHPDVTSSFTVCLVRVFVMAFVSVRIVANFVVFIILISQDNNELIPGEHVVAV